MIAPNRPQPLFEVGQLVRHRRYGYRGVVVAVDLLCKAADAWYQTNRTQTERNQPWYHVLVDSSHATTYAAQTSLRADDSGKPIVHPLIDHYFENFEGVAYQRNDEPFPGW